MKNILCNNSLSYYYYTQIPEAVFAAFNKYSFFISPLPLFPMRSSMFLISDSISLSVLGYKLILVI